MEALLKSKQIVTVKILARKSSFWGGEKVLVQYGSYRRDMDGSVHTYERAQWVKASNVFDV